MKVRCLHFKNGPGVVIKSPRKREIDFDRTGNAGRFNESEQLVQFIQAREPGPRHDAGGAAPVHQHAHRAQFFSRRSLEQKNGLDHPDSLFGQSFLPHFRLYLLETDLVQLVDRHRDVYDLVRKAADLCQTGQHLAVVDLNEYPNSQQAEHPIHDLHEFQFIDLRFAADHIDIALVEFPVPALLRTVGTPDRLYLESLERKGDVILMHHHVAGERHGQIVPEPFLANPLGNRSAVHARGGTILLEIHPGEAVTGIQHPEQQFIALVSVLAQQRGKIFQSGRFDL